jgi:GxxExxY protein
MKHELYLRGIQFESEHIIPIDYKGLVASTILRCDLLVENLLVVELKSVTEIHPIFEAKLLTYMKLLKLPKGLMINFNVKNIFHDGQKTYVNEMYYECFLILLMWLNLFDKKWKCSCIIHISYISSNKLFNLSI